jgi:hypothetical protein
MRIFKGACHVSKADIVRAVSGVNVGWTLDKVEEGTEEWGVAATI